MTNSNVSLDDKYSIESGRIFVTGVQALARIPMVQRQRDVLEGLNTAGFISGYRGSPVGGFDQQLWRAKKFLEQNHIRCSVQIVSAPAGSQLLSLVLSGSR